MIISSNKLAKIISNISAPPVVAVATLAALSLRGSLNTLLAGLVVITVLSLCFTYAWYFFVPDNEANNLSSMSRAPRNAIYMAGVVGSCICTIIFGTEILHDNYWFGLSMVLAIFFASFLLVNIYFDKASMHLGAFAFMVMLVSQQIDVRLGFLLALMPFIIWARITLHKHNWSQISWGWALGMLIGLLTWFI